jgi:hypothetical protein
MEIQKRIQGLITQQQTTLAEVDYLDLKSVAKILQHFDNPNNLAKKSQWTL